MLVRIRRFRSFPQKRFPASRNTERIEVGSTPTPDRSPGATGDCPAVRVRAASSAEVAWQFAAACLQGDSEGPALSSFVHLSIFPSFHLSHSMTISRLILDTITHQVEHGTFTPSCSTGSAHPKRARRDFAAGPFFVETPFLTATDSRRKRCRLREAGSCWDQRSP
jgi:hypothetical protein